MIEPGNTLHDQSKHVGMSKASKLMARAAPFRAVKLPKQVTCFRLAFSDSPRPPQPGSSILNNPHHVLHAQIAGKYLSRDPHSLWWYVRMPISQASKAVVRDWCRRRMKRAINDALLDRGYDAEGRARIGSHAPLEGAAQFSLVEEIITTKFVDLQGQVSVAVDEIIRRAARPAIRPTYPPIKEPGTSSSEESSP